jgi:hypothetical protein
LSLAACITVVALLVLLLSYGDGPTPIVARWEPQPASTPVVAENPPSPAQPAPSTFKWPRRSQRQRKQHHRQHNLGSGRTARRRAGSTAALPDQTQLLQTIARDLANLERTIEQLKANQQQMASDNSKAIGELKASQEEMKRVAREGFRAEPAQGRHRLPRSRRRRSRRACASPSGRRAAAGESAAPIPREWIYDDDW